MIALLILGAVALLGIGYFLGTLEIGYYWGRLTADRQWRRLYDKINRMKNDDTKRVITIDPVNNPDIFSGWVELDENGHVIATIRTGGTPAKSEEK